jgi:hypothetical protein
VRVKVFTPCTSAGDKQFEFEGFPFGGSNANQEYLTALRGVGENGCHERRFTAAGVRHFYLCALAVARRTRPPRATEFLPRLVLIPRPDFIDQVALRIVILRVATRFFGDEK